MKRRDFLRTAGGVAGGTTAVASAGTAAAQEEDGGGGPPDFGGWLSDVSNFDETVDMTGEDEVTVTVGAEGNGGNLAFGPAAVHVDAGTTVRWEWNGKGGGHNVVADNTDFEEYSSGSPVSDEGTTFEYTFETDGISKYYCDPHLGLGMKGAVVVGTDYPTKEAASEGGATPLNPEHMGVPFQAHFVGLSTVVMIIVSLVFTFFLLKYGESPHTSGGNS